MQIVIDIHEKDYQAIKNGHIPFSVLDAIRKGTPLPKNHGRLIDADKIMRVDHIVLESAIDNAPTIIEGSESE